MTRRDINPVLRTVLFVVALLPSLLSAATPKQPDYAGSSRCESCHQAQFKLWSDSDHSWAWRLPTAENVLGDFSNAQFKHRSFTYQMSQRGGDYLVTILGEYEQPQEFKVLYTAGVRPLQQYIVETEPGRLQPLDLTWDTVNKRWYYLYPDQAFKAEEGMHWSGPYKNWNARCAECHATNFQKRYEIATDRYDSRQSEIGVGCEACHGAGEAHLAWATKPDQFKPHAWQGITSKGLVDEATAQSQKDELDQCAGCHSRREPHGANSPPPGEAYAEHYRLAILREGLYFDDGQIDDEVYVYGSFLQSKMHQKGVRCSDCHEPHSGALRLPGNTVCVQCHNPEGNSRFTSLKKNNYDSQAHHFHKPGSEGSQCKVCHMPERNYMVVDGRRDHSFRIPRPDLSAILGSPDPCTACHQDKDTEWAQAVLSKQGIKPTPNDHIGRLFHKARKQGVDATLQAALLSYGLDPNNPGILRATALDILRPINSAQVADKVAGLLGDSDSAVKAAAIALQRGANEKLRIQRLAPLLRDKTRGIRLEAVRGLIDIPPQKLSFGVRNLMKKGLVEFQASLNAKFDFPETQMILGGMALATRNAEAAEQAFSQAVKMDPQQVDAWIMLTKVRALTVGIESAKQTLSKAQAANQGNKVIEQAMNELEQM